jgi:hypothetical protein
MTILAQEEGVTAGIFYTAARDTIQAFIRRGGLAAVFVLALLGVTTQIWPWQSKVLELYN